MRLLQHRSDAGVRSVIAADDGGAWLVGGVETVRDLAGRAIAAGQGLAEAVAACGRDAAVSPLMLRLRR